MDLKNKLIYHNFVNNIKKYICLKEKNLKTPSLNIYYLYVMNNDDFYGYLVDQLFRIFYDYKIMYYKSNKSFDPKIDVYIYNKLEKLITKYTNDNIKIPKKLYVTGIMDNDNRSITLNLKKNVHKRIILHDFLYHIILNIMTFFSKNTLKIPLKRIC